MDPELCIEQAITDIARKCRMTNSQIINKLKKYLKYEN